MITNTIKRIDREIIEVPLIIRANQENWVPTFDIWQTKIDEDISYIDCTQNFRSKLKNYEATEIDSKIGYYDNEIMALNSMPFEKFKILFSLDSDLMGVDHSTDIENISRLYGKYVKERFFGSKLILKKK